jgi:hypothetical protein
MASTYSDLKIELIGTGDQTGTWGTTTNNNFSVAISEAITGSADVAFSSADVTVTLTDSNAAQTARNLRLNLTGTSGGARNLILGSGCQIEKLYLINNGLADAVTVKNTSGTGIAVPAGKSMFVYNNATNVVDAITHLSSLTLGSALPVASGGTGVTSSTGTTNVVLSNSPSLVTPVLGTPSSGNLNSCTADGTNKVGYRNIPLSGIKTTSYTLVAGDVGKFIELGTSGTVVVPASIFTTGDVISIFNNTSGSISCTCSAITDFYKGGTDTDISTFSVTTRGVATILFITATRAVVTGNLA